jgi:hypothetical protein
MSGKKINEAPLQAVMLDNTELPANHEFQDYKVNGFSIKSMLDNAGYLKGLPSGVSVTDQTNGRQWQLDQKRTELTIVAGSPATITPNALISDKFIIQPASAELQLQVPTNAPTVTQMGAVYAPFYFTVIARNSTLGTAGFVSFSSAWSPLAGSRPYNNNAMNIIHCWYHPAGSYYRIETVNVGAVSEEITFDITIPSAQILTSNTSPVTILPAPGANKAIIIDSIIVTMAAGGTPYATNTSGFVIYNNGPQSVGTLVLDELPGRIIKMLYSTGNDSIAFNEHVYYITSEGNPTAGDGDMRLIGKYRIIDLS